MNFEMDEIIKKYNKLSEPFHKKAFDVITGKAIPTESEIEKVKPNLSAEEFEKLKDELKAEVIPDYWLTVFKNCE